MDKCPNVAARFDEVPNWLRQRLTISSSKGRGHGRIPKEIKDIVDSILKSSAVDGFELNMSSVCSVMKDAITAFNDEVVKWRKNREDADTKALDDLAVAGASEDEILALQKDQDSQRTSWPTTVVCAQSDDALRFSVYKFCEEYGFGIFAQDKPTRHLPREHPQVQHVNDFIKYNIQEGKVHEKLVCNFDQVWTCLFEPMKKTLWKKEHGETVKDDLSRYPRRQKMRAALQEHFGSTVQLPVHEQNARWRVKLADIRGYGGTNTVNQWRPHGPDQICWVWIWNGV